MDSTSATITHLCFFLSRAAVRPSFYGSRAPTAISLKIDTAITILYSPNTGGKIAATMMPN